MATMICKGCGEKVSVGGDNQEGTHHYECFKCGPTDAVEVYSGPEDRVSDYPCRLTIEFLCTFPGVSSSEAERKGGQAAEKMFKVLQYHAKNCTIVQLSTRYDPGADIALPDQT